MYKEMILITGVPRSGTSMTAGIIERCGAFGGKTRPPNSHNKKGMYENSFIVQSVIKPYLKRMGCDPLGQSPLPNIDKLIAFPELRKEVIATMISEGGAPHPVWYYKGAKLCLFHPVVHEAFPNAKWVVVRRKDENTVSSLMRTPFMKAYRVEAGWQEYIEHHKKRFEEIVGQYDAMEVWTEDIIDGNMGGIKFIVDWCGLKWNDDAVSEFVDPTLYTKKQ